MSAYTRQKAKSKYRNRIRLERAYQKQSSDTHKTPYDRVKRCQEQCVDVDAISSAKDAAPRNGSLRAKVTRCLRSRDVSTFGRPDRPLLVGRMDGHSYPHQSTGTHTHTVLSSPSARLNRVVHCLAAGCGAESGPVPRRRGTTYGRSVRQRNQTLGVFSRGSFFTAEFRYLVQARVWLRWRDAWDCALRNICTKLSAVVRSPRFPFQARYEATVAERLARSSLTKANRVQSRAGLPDFRKWESCRTMPLVGGFSRGSPVFPAPSFRRLSIFTSIILTGSQGLAVKSSPDLFTRTPSPLQRNCVVPVKKVPREAPLGREIFGPRSRVKSVANTSWCGGFIGAIPFPFPSSFRCVSTPISPHLIHSSDWPGQQVRPSGRAAGSHQHQPPLTHTSTCLMQEPHRSSCGKRGRFLINCSSCPFYLFGVIGAHVSRAQAGSVPSRESRNAARKTSSPAMSRGRLQAQKETDRSRTPRSGFVMSTST
ncbi:hypothetical protein PR048_008157 [Dryococelus australis]|uniref:Uncharacterized protein n=1 Tax=Dryococelus australis TaxID=614101 RepID=A0ABQ9HWE6_9NEOP|nr:hypothetical protein PR048_008157 [Dryococelus australis]